MCDAGDVRGEIDTTYSGGGTLVTTAAGLSIAMLTTYFPALWGNTYPLTLRR